MLGFSPVDLVPEGKPILEFPLIWFKLPDVCLVAAHGIARFCCFDHVLKPSRRPGILKNAYSHGGLQLGVSYLGQCMPTWSRWKEVRSMEDLHAQGGGVAIRCRGFDRTMTPKQTFEDMMVECIVRMLGMLLLILGPRWCVSSAAHASPR